MRREGATFSTIDNRIKRDNHTIRKTDNAYDVLDVHLLKSLGYNDDHTEWMVPKRSGDILREVKARGAYIPVFASEREMLGKQRKGIQKISSGNDSRGDKNRDWKQKYDRYRQRVKRKDRREDVKMQLIHEHGLHRL